MFKKCNFMGGGKPIFNVDIEIERINMNNAKQDENGHIFPGDIKNIATAINYAEEVLVGPRHVTDKGYLDSGWKGSELPTIKGTIDVMENLTQLLRFSRTNEKRVVLSFHYKENGAVGHITLDKKEGIIFNNALDLEKEIRELRKTNGLPEPMVWPKSESDLDVSGKQSKQAGIIAKDGCPYSEARRH
jgi:hypothetical protein